MTKITIDDIKKVANLIKIHLDEEELESYRKQLATSLDPVKVFEDLDLEDVEPTYQTTGLTNRLAEDIPQPSLPQKDAVMNANKTINGYIVVKRFVKNEH